MFCLLSTLRLLLGIALLRTATPETINILQLGDSYSSGTGARNSRGRVDYESWWCSRSASSWGSQYAAEISKTYNITYTNRACGNARFTNIWNPQQFWVRPHLICKRRWSRQPDFYFERVGLFRCAKYAKPQITHVDESVDLILMTMGGNDAGFIDIVRSCLMRFNLADARACRKRLDAAYASMNGTAAQAEQALLDIWDSMGQSGKIVFFGYPYIVEDVSRVLQDPLLGVEYDAPQEVRKFADFGNSELRKATQRASAAAGEDFIEFWNKTTDLFAGHEPDPYNLRLNRDRWMHEVRAPRLYESFHPNGKGHAEWGAALVEEGLFGLEH